MKKFVVTLLIVFFSSISLAHIGHYNKFDKIEMEILRNDEVIGYNNYFFKRDGEKTIVKNQYKFEVKLLSATIFKVEGYGDCLLYTSPSPRDRQKSRMPSSA